MIRVRVHGATVQRCIDNYALLVRTHITEPIVILGVDGKDVTDIHLHDVSDDPDCLILRTQNVVLDNWLIHIHWCHDDMEYEKPFNGRCILREEYGYNVCIEMFYQAPGGIFSTWASRDRECIVFAVEGLPVPTLDDYLAHLGHDVVTGVVPVTSKYEYNKLNDERWYRKRAYGTDTKTADKLPADIPRPRRVLMIVEFARAGYVPEEVTADDHSVGEELRARVGDLVDRLSDDELGALRDLLASNVQCSPKPVPRNTFEMYWHLLREMYDHVPVDTLDDDYDDDEPSPAFSHPAIDMNDEPAIELMSRMKLHLDPIDRDAIKAVLRVTWTRYRNTSFWSCEEGTVQLRTLGLWSPPEIDASCVLYDEVLLDRYGAWNPPSYLVYQALCAAQIPRPPYHQHPTPVVARAMLAAGF